MAEDSGKGKRQVKPKFVEGFVYDKESLGFLSSRANSGSTTLRHTSQESISTKVSYKESEKPFAHNPWSGIQFLSTDVHYNSQLGSESVGYCLDNSICEAEGSHSPGQHQNVSSDDSELCFGVTATGPGTTLRPGWIILTSTVYYQCHRPLDQILRICLIKVRRLSVSAQRV